MKHLKTYEQVNYGKVNPDDEYNIDIVTRDDNHEYKYCDNVLYELSHSGNDKIVNINYIENTPENMFYNDQIDRYVQYIEEGGILQTFPVHSNKKADNLEDMLNWFDEDENGFDVAYDLLNKNKKMFDLYVRSFWNIVSEPESYGFDEESLSINDPLKTIYSIEDLHEVYNEENENYDEDILRGLEDIIKYFEDEEEYTLQDFNHRFEALKRLGKEHIYVEEI